jgi:tRNA-dihydrouridine synthase B
MIGRGAQGNPWIFQQINHYLEQGNMLPNPSLEQISQMMERHLQALHEFYGEVAGVRISRKHMGWYSSQFDGGKAFTQHFNTLNTRLYQRQFLKQFFLNRINQEQAA